MGYLEVKYSGLVSSRLPLFKVKKHSPYLAVFRCIWCGDSRKKKSKTRGGIYESAEGEFRVGCFNCGVNYTFSYFLKELDEELYREYRLERYLDQRSPEPQPALAYKTNKPIFIADGSLAKLRRISSLPDGHPAKRYITERMIPASYHSKLFFASEFFQWARAAADLPPLGNPYDEPRLVIPFVDKANNMFGFQGRSLESNAEMRYITYLIDPDMPKVFNLDSVDFSQTTYVTEGAFDAMFLPNSLAMLGSDLTFRSLEIDQLNTIFIFDNEPRSLPIVRRMERAIKANYAVFVWPEAIKHKDLNEMVLNGWDVLQIKRTIDSNSLRGFGARLRLDEWKRC